ncbi:MAG: type I methionyl aminopeptidase [Rhodospirillaceae bacterium]|nr:type I methionyl aminopeptidase [Rhodospirillaceae bacterium]|tara:strand:- start:343 stop:1161 length:819 start_codon:yes stop_codon:yes gene_type:complete
MSYIDSTNAPEINNGLIKIHSKSDFDGMRIAGRIASNTLDMITEYVKPGIKTEDLDNICRDYIENEGAIPAPLNYRGFPKSICTSVNHVVCHGIPGEKVLEKGDILNIDVTVIYNGWHGDTSRMFFVGDVSIKARKLSDITYEAMMRGIEIIKPGITTGDIGHAIQTYAESKKYSVVRDFCGHGIGKVFHDAPNILHYGQPDSGIELREGMFFTVEPMINIGKWQVKMLNDGWTAVTRDKSLSAQFEHSVAVTSNGFEIFTESSIKKCKPPF